MDALPHVRFLDCSGDRFEQTAKLLSEIEHLRSVVKWLKLSCWGQSTAIISSSDLRKMDQYALVEVPTVYDHEAAIDLHVERKQGQK